LVRWNKGLFEPDLLVLILHKSVPCKSAPPQQVRGARRWAGRAELRWFLCLGLPEQALHQEGEQNLADLWAGVSRWQSVAVLWNKLGQDFKQKEYCLVVTHS